MEIKHNENTTRKVVECGHLKYMDFENVFALNFTNITIPLGTNLYFNQFYVRKQIKIHF